ncbi:MAG: redoxin domain-containing protein [Phycisphaerales bacterium]|nr:redoxin domain-containing protein [Phycisphaerales bacterium]
MDSNKRNTTLATITACAAMLSILPLLAMAPIKRESTNNRAALTQLETKPLDPAALASLTDWTHPGTLSPENIKGRVVLLAVISAANPQSIMTISKLTRLRREFADQGIIVAGIHPDIGFELITEKITSGRIKIPIARDAGGVFAAAMHTDDYPDLYLIDRAGNLRFADLDKKSLKDAINLLTAENTETAQSNAALQAQGLQPVAAAQTNTPETSGHTNPASGSMQDHTTKTTDHSSGNWPPHNNKNLYASKNSQGKKLPFRLGLNEDWITEEHLFEGKILILDFWVSHSSSGKKALKIYNKLLEAHPGQIEVVGISGSETKEKVINRLEGSTRNYTHLYDSDLTLQNALGITNIPNVVILSTDGIIRWQGVALERGFVEVVEQIIAADPMVHD